VGFVHTLAGPDHYLPFVMISRARRWGAMRTALVTLVCGLGHVLSSIVIGAIGIAIGAALVKLQVIESFRGDLAAWGLTAFGFVYLLWGLYKARRGKPHLHLHGHRLKVHAHAHGGHEHVHPHEGHAHLHPHEAHPHATPERANITPWVLFIVFVFGPCEPLIPLLMVPAARESVAGLVFISVVFAATTIGTMLAIVLSASFGLSLLPFGKLERYTHALAGGAICLCGCSILFLGL
jgi:hypothetical protein